MKNLKISVQLILLEATVIVIAAAIFITTTLINLSHLAENELYSRLDTYVYLLDENDIINDRLKNADMPIEYEIVTDSVVYKSENLNKMILDTEVTSLIASAKESHQEKEYVISGKIENAGNVHYYVIETADNMNTYKVIVTDNSYPSTMVQNVSISVIVLFIILMAISIYATFLWSNKNVKRIHNIQNHIISIPKDKYEATYVDDSNDEIGELSKSVEVMRKEIGRNEKIKQEMLQNISHDFKTPIAVIKSYAEAFQDGMADADSARIIINQADVLKNKVNRLLQYNSLEYLDNSKPFETIDMKELIEEITQNMKYVSTLQIVLDLDDGIYFKGYRDNFITVIENILDNARRYAKTKIEITLKPGRLRIYNDGEPIDEQFLTSVFKPYEKGSKGEFGLGMSIVKKTLDFFGLRLKVENEPQGGVAFIIVSPPKEIKQIIENNKTA